MGKLAIAFGVILFLVLLARFMMPGVPLISRIPILNRMLPERGGGAIQHVMSPPYMFHLTDANTRLNLP
jgi:hypothetical protein